MQSCPHCISSAPFYEQAAEDLVAAHPGKVNFINIDSYAVRDFSGTYGIRRVPSFLVFKGGQLVTLSQTSFEATDDAESWMSSFL